MSQKTYKYSQQDFDNAVLLVNTYNKYIDAVTNPRKVLLDLIDMLAKDEKADSMSTMGFHVVKENNYIRIYFSLYSMNAGFTDWVTV